MNIANGAQENEMGGTPPTIPGPYHSPEQTEAFPLKQSLYRKSGAGNRTSGLWFLAGCFSGSRSVSDRSGTSLRIIVSCFMTLTLAVIIALAIQIYYGDYQLVPHGSVATDSRECSIIGTEILKSDGNAVDAAIASTICLGVVNPHVTGLGGGGFMIIYNHRKRKVLDAIDFREVAPAIINISNEAPGSVVGVPGFLRGLHLAHQLHGKLPWKDIVMPAVRIASAGFLVPDNLVRAAKFHLTPNSYSGDLVDWVTHLEAGQYLPPLTELAATLELIADRGPDVLYNGSLAKHILKTVNDAGGKMTPQDLASYQAMRRPALETTFADFNVLVPDLPSGGPALLETLRLLPDLNSSADTQGISLPKFITKLVEASEETYERALHGIWGDPDFIFGNDNIGLIENFNQSVGSHVAAVDLNDIYVSVVSGLNTWFGSQLRTNGGFILNNALANFGVGNNSPRPGKRPISLAAPVIAVEKRRVCGRRLVLGSADPALAVQLLSRLLVLDKNLTLSVEAPRFQVANGEKNIFLEDFHVPKLGEPSTRLLLDSGYQLQSLAQPYQSCNLVEKIGDDLASHSDSRGGGVASRF